MSLVAHSSSQLNLGVRPVAQALRSQVSWLKRARVQSEARWGWCAKSVMMRARKFVSWRRFHMIPAVFCSKGKSTQLLTAPREGAEVHLP